MPMPVRCLEGMCRLWCGAVLVALEGSLCCLLALQCYGTRTVVAFDHRARHVVFCGVRVPYPMVKWQCAVSGLGHDNATCLSGAA